MKLDLIDKEWYLKIERGELTPNCCECSEELKEGSNYFFRRIKPLKNFFWCSRECAIKTSHTNLNPYANAIDDNVEIKLIILRLPK